LSGFSGATTSQRLPSVWGEDNGGVKPASAQAFNDTMRSTVAAMPQSWEIPSFTERYSLGKLLGQGGFSPVYLCKDVSSGDEFAAKVVSKDGISDDDIRNLTTEIECLKAVKHEHVMEFEGIFQDQANYFMVCELLDGGDLLDNILRTKTYSEPAVRLLTKQLVETMVSKRDDAYSVVLWVP
jgi:serine/threonine protein kinase